MTGVVIIALCNYNSFRDYAALVNLGENIRLYGYLLGLFIIIGGIFSLAISANKENSAILIVLIISH